MRRGEWVKRRKRERENRRRGRVGEEEIGKRVGEEEKGRREEKYLHFNHLVFNGIHNQSGCVFAAGFAKNICPVFFHGSLTDK